VGKVFAPSIPPPTNSLILFGIRKNLPDQQKETIIVPIHEKGDKTDCNNYPGMSLL
jgi:hypothetical protein